MMADKIEILNELLALHSTSLAMYLSNAKPWTIGSDPRATQALDEVAADHKRMVDRIGRVILGYDGIVRYGEFPMQFTDLHDLSTEFLISAVQNEQQSTDKRITEIVESLGEFPEALAVAQEAAGASKGHLDNLADLMAESSA